MVRHRSITPRRPPPRTQRTPIEQLMKEFRKEGVLVASPADVPPRRVTVGADALVRHAEPVLELDADAIEEVATPVVEHDRSTTPPSTHIYGTSVDIEEAVIELMEKVETLEDEVRRLKRRLADHNHGDARRAKDDVNERILAVLRRVAPLKLTTSTIGENLDLDTTLVGNRLRNMVGKDGVQSSKRAGTNTGISWWVEKPVELMNTSTEARRRAAAEDSYS
jgi:hypothetical protein